MAPKLFTTVFWMLVAGAWVAFALFLRSWASWGDGASSSFYNQARYICEGLLLWIPLMEPALAALSPYDWFPKNALRFACWPWSPLSCLAGLVAGWFAPGLVS